MSAKPDTSSSFSSNDSWIYPVFFFVILLAYIICYAPYGINETDGGFISAYAWRMMNGEVFYRDFIYVRPPLSIMLRSIEMGFLPDHLEIIGERISFYLKIAFYSYLGATILYNDSKKWLLAILGFILSVHAYPAAAWHTVDGILLAIISLYFYFKRDVAIGLCAVFALGSMLSKQSFYPLLPLLLVLTFLQRNYIDLLKFIVSFVLVGAFFIWFLYGHDILENFLTMTSGSSSLMEAFQHGILDYFIIDWKVLGLLIFLIPTLLKNKFLISKRMWFVLFISALASSYAFAVLKYQTFTNPISHVRILFLIAFLYLLINRVKTFNKFQGGFLDFLKSDAPENRALILLAVLWMSAISWGYNLPILFAIPVIYAIIEYANQFSPSFNLRQKRYLNLYAIIGLLLIFRLAYQFVYRDGNRNEMTYKMEEIFPKLKYIYSDQDTYDKYADLKNLNVKYGDDFKTLPSFPLSNYLTNTNSPLPLDWVFNAETNGQNNQIYQALENFNGYIFMEKAYIDKIENMPKYEVSKYVLTHYKLVEKTPNFFIYKR